MHQIGPDIPDMMRQVVVAFVRDNRGPGMWQAAEFEEATKDLATEHRPRVARNYGNTQRV